MKISLKPGDTAPDFSLLNQDKKRLGLSDFSGKWIILYFYPKDDTPGCTIEAIDFSNFFDSISDKKAVVIGISADSCESHSRFMEKKNLKVILLSDPEKTIINLYGCYKPKKLFGKEVVGIIRSTFLIDPHGKIKYVWEKVKVAGHAEAVLKKIDELTN